MFYHRWGFRWGRGRKQQSCPHPDWHCEVLSEARQDERVKVICNRDHRTLERGLYNGVEITILRNEPDEPNMVIAVSDARYGLDKKIANRIRVKPLH